jgi:transcriptional regulator with XRE-family HTH domain
MAFGHPQQGDPNAAVLRKEAGRYLKDLREKADLTQNALSKLLGFEYYTMISQVEGGKARIPPDKMLAWAKAVKTDPKVFARTLLRYYDPFMWQVLFGSDKGGS